MFDVFTGTYLRAKLFDTETDARGLVHESQHRQDFKDNPLKFYFTPEREIEKNALEAENRFLRKIGSKEINIEEMLATEWWKVPILERDY
jgi:hypothetical protein